jgi:hypothetical protein
MNGSLTSSKFSAIMDVVAIAKNKGLSKACQRLVCATGVEPPPNARFSELNRSNYR